MGYTGPYSLWRRCISEFLAMTMVIFLGESIIANELLPGTKGHEMGWGFIAFGFGMSFFIPIQMFGVISAHINPASLLALWVIGDLSAGDFFALFGAEMLGAFFGAVLVWLFFLPHFNTTPRPPSLRKDDELLHSSDTYAHKALKVASYTTQPQRMVQRKPLDATLAETKNHLAGISEEDDVHSFIESYFQKEDPLKASSLRRRTVQVADLQWEAAKGLHHESPNASVPSSMPLPTRQHIDPDTTPQQDTPHNTHSLEDHNPTPTHNSIHVNPSHNHAHQSTPYTQHEMDEALKLYHAARTADQNAKLAIFATRPAIYHPLFNWIAEFVGTLVLILCALLFENRLGYVGKADAALADNALSAFLVGMLVFVLVLGLGGPTGYAANPARDMGPRLAHFVLPIVGKGSSEFIYSWIPFTATLAGGAVAGGLFLLIKKLFIPPEN